MNRIEVDSFVQQYWGVDMGDHWFITFGNMEKLINAAIEHGKSLKE